MRKSSLTKSIQSALLISAAMSGVAYAQSPTSSESSSAQKISNENNAPTEDATVTLDRVQVTGYRGSINRSIDEKRDSDVISDVISAEDVGKFPDTNVAESLQRITGVQITREANEGKYVSVRGLPTEFNYVTLNGQAVTSASDNQTVQGADRNFDFSLLSPNFVSAIQVYKSSKADLEEGGISATINVRTLRPLDLGERRIAASAEAQRYDVKGDAEPNVSALYSDVFADKTWGITLGAALNKRAYQSQFSDTAQFDEVTIDDERFLMLDNNSVNFNDQSRETKTYYGALQFSPGESFTASLIGLHADYSGKSLSGALAVRPIYTFDPGTFDYSSDANNVLTRVVGDDIYVGAGNFRQSDESKLDNLTLELDWSLGRWDVVNNLNYSKSTTHSQEIGFDMLRAGVWDFGTAVSGGYEILPNERVASFVLDPAFDPADSSAFLNGYIGGNVLDRSDKLWSEQLDVSYTPDNGFIESVKAGVKYSDRKRNNSAYFLLDMTQRGTDVSEFSASSPVMNLLGEYGGTAYVPGNVAFYDPNIYLDSLYGGSYNGWANAGTTENQVNPSNQYDVSEETSAAYLMANYKFDSAVPIHGNIGVRVVRTKQSVTNSAVDFDAIEFIEPAPLPPAPAVIIPPAGTLTFNRSYTDVLPSLNVIADLSEDVVLRFAAAKVMTRPNLESLVPRYSVSVDPDIVSGGNPDLDPFRANQYDLSLEWYFQPGSILSAAAYYKDIKSFIQQGSEPFDIQGRTFTRLKPVNGTGGFIRGAEIGYTQSFDFLPSFWSGLGFQANLTYADGEVDEDTVNNLPAHDFSGLSKITYNATLFYEKDGLGIRFAYNHRDRFLADPNIRGQNTSKAYGDAFSTLDFQASYDVNSSVSLFLEGSNLLKEKQVSTMEVIGGDGSKYPLTWYQGDRRLALGVRLKF